MINVPLIVVATAFVVCALIAKALTREPKKASKSQKAEILKQLLELSEHETRGNGVASRTPVHTSRPQTTSSATTPRMKQQQPLRPIRSSNRLSPASGASSSVPR
jgi:hypothetical protein